MAGAVDARGGGSVSAAMVLTRDRFAQLVMARLRTRGATELSYEPGTFSLSYRLADGQGGANLANVYASACQAPPPEVAGLIDGFLSALDEQRQRAGAGFEAVAARLMPGLRDERSVSLSQLQLAMSGLDCPDIQTPTVAGEVVRMLFLDAERSTAQVNDGHLQEWGVGFEQAMERAMQNLRARSAPNFIRQAEGLYLSGWNDDYDGARLLLPELLTQLPLRGEPVVGLPSRGRLLVAGSRDPAALDRLAQLCADLLESEPRPMTANLLHYSRGRWVLFEEPLPARRRLHEAEQKMLQGDYERQKALLEPFMQKKGADVFFASLQMFETPQGLLSVAQWTRDVASLLPKADNLALLDLKSREMLVVPWPQAAALLGEGLKPQGLYPERYLVHGFPEKDLLKKLRAVAVTKARV